MIQLVVVAVFALVAVGFLLYLVTHLGRQHGPGCAPSQADR